MNKAALLAYADANLTARSVVPAAFYVPPYYADPTLSDAAKAPSAQDTYNVAAFARAYLYTKDSKYTDAISSILGNWAKTCTSVSTKDDTPLVACYHWYKVFEAVTLIAKAWPGMGLSLAATINPFAANLLLSAFQSIAKNFNNWQSWSIFAQAKLLVMHEAVGITPSVGASALKAKISSHLKWSTIDLPFINRANEFWTENVRGNNSLRYTHFSLAPLLLADRALAGGEDFAPYIAAFAVNCRNPNGYYARYGTSSWLGHITKLFASSSTAPELPDPTSWSGEFFFYVSTAMKLTGYQDLWTSPPFNLGPGGELLYFVENDAELGVLT